ARRAGAEVTILEQGPSPLIGFDASLVDRLVALGAGIGIAVRANTDVVGVQKMELGFEIRLSELGAAQKLVADLVVHGAGRIPDVAELGLDLANIEIGDRGIAVNEYLQSTSNPAVYAAGDCVRAGGLPLTPVAGLEGETAGRNVTAGNTATLDFSGLASIVYTLPSLASVGLSEEQAKKKGISFKTHAGDATTWYSSRHVNAAAACYKVLVDDRDNIVGAHFLGPNVEELVNLFSLAVRAKIPGSVMKEVLYAWPTTASDMEYMLD
ncbi:MAG: FAD-dependent oxidoreductase, partial [Candidatus Baltobacteraceae bacterium]